MAVWRWTLVGLLFLTGAVVAALLDPHVPRVVVLSAGSAFGIAGCFLMEANLERRRRARAGR